MNSLTSTNSRAARRRLGRWLKIAALGLFAFFVLRMIGSRFTFPRWLFGPTYAAVSTACPGDINLDGQRDIRDLTLLQAHVSGKQLLAGARLDAADVNGDGKVDVLDVVRLQQHVTHQALLADCAAATMTVLPGTLDFGSVNVGSNKDLTLAVGNVGSTGLTVSSISSSNGVFSLASPSLPFSVVAGGQQSVTVRFTPVAAGTQGGTLQISGTSGGAPQSASVTLSGTGAAVANNPVPAVSSITPTSATAGGSGVTLTVNGSNFVASSVVRWDGAPRPTTFVTSTELTAAIPATDLANQDSAAVTVFNPGPGGGNSNTQVFQVNSKIAAGGPTIRYIAPAKGKTGSQFTLLGTGFDASASRNTVTFSLDDSNVSAAISSASETTIVATVPVTLQTGKVYGVTVTVNGQKSNAVGYEISADAARLAVTSSFTFLLMPPGTGKEFLVIGGGTPPYKLDPLSAEDQSKARAELKGNVVEVTGLDPGKFGSADVSILVRDSAGSPATASATVRVQNPTFDPSFDIVAHNLLAGSSPGFNIRVGTSYGQMRLVSTKLVFGGIRGNFSSLASGQDFALTNIDSSTYGLVNVSAVSSADKMSFEANANVSTTLDDAIAGRTTFSTLSAGTMENSGGAVVLRETAVPEPPAEDVTDSGTDTEVILADRLLQLPPEPGTTFTVTAVLTSASVFEGKALPMTKVVTKTFKTVSPAAGAPRITRLLPIHAERGHILEIDGAGFSSTPASNKVTFAALSGDRVEGEVISAAPEKIKVVVPAGVAGDPVRVTVNNLDSNDHWFRMMFQPEGVIAFPSFKANTPVGPTLVFSQPNDRVKVATAKGTLDDGRVNTAGLVKGQAAGTVEWYRFGKSETLQLIYQGQETSGAKRHSFDLNETGAFGSVRAQLFMSDSSGGKGVTFELKFVGSYDLKGQAILVQFDKPVYQPPAASGATVNSSLEFVSDRWMFFLENNFSVTFKAKATTE